MKLKHTKPFRHFRRDRKNELPERKAFYTTIDICNFSPEGYFYSTDWADYLQGAVKYYAGVIERANPDDFNGKMFRSEIQSHRRLMATGANDQSINHRSVLLHHQRVLNGKVTCAIEQLKLLEKDLEDIDDRLNQLRTMKGENDYEG